MSTATAIQKFFEERHMQCETMPHLRTATTLDSAQAAHVDADCVAKAVMLGDERGLLMAVIPASHQVRMKMLRRETGRNLHMVAESEFAARFPDCEVGAIPPIGGAYGMETIWDDCLGEMSDIYFEAGDHENLMRISAHDFVDMMRDSRHGCISSPR